MFRTSDGMTMNDVVKELGYLRHSQDFDKILWTFDVYGDGEKYDSRFKVHAKVSELFVEFCGGGNSIRVPNFCHVNLAEHLEAALKLMFFMYNINMHR